jgi:hypothetical protein
MSFTAYRDGRAPTMDYCTISHQSRKDRGMVFVVRMRHTVPPRLRWSEGNLLSVFFGDGPDVGKIRLKRGNRFARGLHRESSNKYPPGGAPFFVRFKSPFKDVPVHRAVRCKWRIAANDPDALEIDLPKWARLA